MKFFIFSILFFILLGCRDSDSGPVDDGLTQNTPQFSLQCELTNSYLPSSAPMTNVGAGVPDTTVIALHGKNGAPTRTHMQILANDLSTSGYNVVMPYMPWSGLAWNGTLCDGVAYINELVVTEKNKGNSVILMGHSLAGPIVLAYSAIDNTTKADAVSIVAPGHFPHQSSTLASAHESSIASAQSMIENGEPDAIATFETFNNGASVTISATPTAYLSVHDTTQFPNILASIPLIAIPVLWLAGEGDSLTAAAKNLGIIDMVTTDSDYTYKEVSGDHFSVMNNVAEEVNNWYANQ